MEVKQSTTRNVMVFMTDSADHITGKTGLTLTITASKDGGAFASISPTVTERGNGWYNIALTAADTDTLGDLCLHVTGTGADPADLKLHVVANLEADTYSRIGTPAGASVSADIASIQADTNDLQTQIGTAGAGLTNIGDTRLGNLDAAVSSRQPVGAVDLNADQSGVTIGTVNALGTQAKADVNAECDTALADYGALKGGTAMTESYAADGAAMTPEQALYMIWAMLSEKSISGTTLTVKKLDGSTTAMQFTLDDGTSPTSITRSS